MVTDMTHGCISVLEIQGLSARLGYDMRVSVSLKTLASLCQLKLAAFTKDKYESGNQQFKKLNGVFGSLLLALDLVTELRRFFYNS